MEPIRNILVVVDPTSREQPAVAKGALLAFVADLHPMLELIAAHTAESVLERLPCDALVVKAHGFADQSV